MIDFLETLAVAIAAVAGVIGATKKLLHHVHQSIKSYVRECIEDVVSSVNRLSDKINHIKTQIEDVKDRLVQVSTKLSILKEDLEQTTAQMTEVTAQIKSVERSQAEWINSEYVKIKGGSK